MPAPVIVTSGTAVANLMPAVLESHEGRVPFLALTADRPVELRGVRSNQTTRQAGLFDAVARFSVDIDVDAVAGGAGGEQMPEGAPTRLVEHALRAAIGRRGGAPAGPVQVNLAFREPLSGWGEGSRADFGAGEMTAGELFAAIRARGVDPLPGRSAADGPDAELMDDGWRMRLEWTPDEVYLHGGDALTVVIAGDGAGPEAEAFAHAAGLPLLAEAVSGSRFGREAITAYATLLDDPEVGGLVERVVVFGHPTLTRQIPALLARDDVEAVVVDPHTGDGVEHYDPVRRARIVRSARVSESYDPKRMHRWLGVWVTADRVLRAERSTVHEPDLEAARATGYRERSAYARSEVAVLREPVTRELLVESLWRATWPHDRLVIAASRLVRVLDGIAPPRRLEVRSNRGLAGIDGTIATALGVAASSQASDDPTHAAGATRVLIGDLALLHDAGSLLWPDEEPRPRIQLFVGVDGGGTIFDTLEAAQTSSREAMERVMYTPQRVDIARLASAYGWDYMRIADRGALSRFLTVPVQRSCIVELPLDR